MGPTRISIDCETDSKNPLIANPVTVQVTNDHGTWVCNPAEPDDIAFLRELWINPNYLKTFQNGGAYDIIVLERLLGVPIQGYAWDTLLAEHLIHEESSYNLEVARGVYTDQPVYERPIRLWKEEVIEVPVVKLKKPTKTDIKKGITEPYEVTKYRKQKRGEGLDGYAGVPREILVPYGVYDSQTTHMVQKQQEKLLDDKRKQLLTEVTLPMQLALMDMARNGIHVNVNRIPEVREFYVNKANELAKKVFEAADEEFKITSPDEVKRVLFDELGLPKPPVKSKTTGVVSSGKKALDWMSRHVDHPVIGALEEWRGANQLVNNFLGRPNEKGEIKKGLMSNMTAEGKLHTTFRMTLETGRNSSSPNLQNLPVENKGPIRELFVVSRPDNLLLQADFSQIELRIAAYESGDNKLISLLESGGDVHTAFARKLYPFEAELSDADWKKKYDSYRTLAKRFTFGRLFGQGEQGMALTFNIPTEEALRFQKVYSDLFPNMSEWWDATTKHIRAGNPLVTKWGRHRFFPYHKFANINWRGKNAFFSHMDREGLNFMPQGSAADCLNKACGNIRYLINRYNLAIILRLVVHDSLTIECHEDYAYTAAKFMKAEMESVGEQFGWKLPVEIKHGRTWAGEMGTLKV